MAKTEVIKCDNCEKQKGVNNHWWTIEYDVATKSMFIHPLEYKSETIYSMIIKNLDACGLECLGILESKIKEGIDPKK